MNTITVKRAFQYRIYPNVGQGALSQDTRGQVARVRRVRLVYPAGSQRRTEHSTAGWTSPLRYWGARIPRALAVGVSTGLAQQLS